MTFAIVAGLLFGPLLGTVLCLAWSRRDGIGDFIIAFLGRASATKCMPIQIKQFDAKHKLP